MEVANLIKLTFILLSVPYRITKLPHKTTSLQDNIINLAGVTILFTAN